MKVIREKMYQLNGYAIGKDGLRHEITIVGKMSENEMMVQKARQINASTAKNKRGKQKNGLFVFNEKVRQKVFKIGYAICNPRDKYDLNVGIKEATRRLKKSPIGTLKTESYTMLQDDMCELLVLNQLMHVASNIDRYTSKKKKKK